MSGTSHRIDETYVKVGKELKYLNNVFEQVLVQTLSRADNQ